MKLETPLSHLFLTAVAPARDHLYALAVAGAPALTPSAKLEAVLQKAFRLSFAAYLQDPSLDPVRDIEGHLTPTAATVQPFATQAAPSAADPAPAVMPADLWARLHAAVQIEAAQSHVAGAGAIVARGGAAGSAGTAGAGGGGGGTRGVVLNPDSVLLVPDPLLAPKKTAKRDDIEGFDLSTPSRFLLAAGIAIVIGVLLTIYIMSRPPTGPRNAASPASASAPAIARPASLPGAP